MLAFRLSLEAPELVHWRAHVVDHKPLCCFPVQDGGAVINGSTSAQVTLHLTKEGCEISTKGESQASKYPVACMDCAPFFQKAASFVRIGHRYC
jgi:hypothetical protein